MRVLVFLCLCAVGCAQDSLTAQGSAAFPTDPSPSATWPWPDQQVEKRSDAVTRFTSVAEDGTQLELYRFDLERNPKLRFELYDQDEDDAQPLDNKADYFPNGVGQVTRHLNQAGRGKVLLAWNGLFFAYDRSPGSPPKGWARHIGPNVIDGKVRYNVGNARWASGVEYPEPIPVGEADDVLGKRGPRPIFKAVHMASKGYLAKQFDYASVGAQCLIKDGKPLRLQPIPRIGDPPPRQPVPSTAKDAGHIPWVDHIRTSRTSIGWSKDSETLYVLIVVEPDTETASKLTVRQGKLSEGGWTVADLQRFWLKLGVWGAVNSDGGVVTQRTWLRPDGRYDLLTPQTEGPHKHLILGSEMHGAPAGGTLMTFYVSERP